MKAKNKIITAILLSAGTAAGTALINKYIKMTAISKNLLSVQEPHCYKWRLGNIHYTKIGNGKPLLLIHDLDSSSSGCEWDNLISQLKNQYTIYTIDLLGCGRSEKPNLTYTNFLYVQLINDFIKSEIGPGALHKPERDGQTRPDPAPRLSRYAGRLLPHLLKRERHPHNRPYGQILS